MRGVIIDENLPRSFGNIFREHGFEPFDVRDHGLRGALDSTVFLFAKEHHAAVATSDIQFSNQIHLFEFHHFGVFLLRLPTSLSVKSRCEELSRLLKKLPEQSIANLIITISPGSLRIHGQHPQ